MQKQAENERKGHATRSGGASGLCEARCYPSSEPYIGFVICALGYLTLEDPGAFGPRHPGEQRLEERRRGDKYSTIADATLTAKVCALGVEHVLGDLEEAFWAHHRPVDVLGLDTAPVAEVEHP